MDAHGCISFFRAKEDQATDAFLFFFECLSSKQG